jgi:exodeoxyribonuclease VII small subunit
MTSEQLAQMTYEEKEARLDEILSRLDNSATPMDELGREAREAAQLLMSMHQTLKAAKQEITDVFAEMERQKEAVSLATRSELASVDGKGA